MEAKEVPSRYHVSDRILLEHWSKQRASWMNGGPGKKPGTFPFQSRARDRFGWVGLNRTWLQIL